MHEDKVVCEGATYRCNSLYCGLNRKRQSTSISTASRWLHELGFTHQFSKGVYFDGQLMLLRMKNLPATLDAYSPMWISQCPSHFASL